MSSNPFDIIDARFVGWNAAWVQRDKKIVFDLLDVRFTKRPFSIISAQRPLQGAKRTLKTLEITILKGRSRLRFQPIDATHSLNFSAGE